jgi:hypothetical protein
MPSPRFFTEEGVPYCEAGGRVYRIIEAGGQRLVHLGSGMEDAVSGADPGGVRGGRDDVFASCWRPASHSKTLARSSLPAR